MNPEVCLSQSNMDQIRHPPSGLRLRRRTPSPTKSASEVRNARQRTRAHAPNTRTQERTTRPEPPKTAVTEVVEHEQAWGLSEPLRGASTDVGLLRRSQSATAAAGVAHAEHGTDLRDDILRAGNADELDDVDDGKRRVAGEEMSEPRLAEPARSDDQTQPASRSSSRAAVRDRARDQAAPSGR